VGPGQLRALGEVRPWETAALSLRDTDEALANLARATGSGSGARRIALLRDLRSERGFGRRHPRPT
jgi:hypothetical protein